MVGLHRRARLCDAERSLQGELARRASQNSKPIFFNEGKAIHAFSGSVGGPASHGCVRLSTGNAKALFRLVEEQQGLTGFKYDTTIIVR